jgi:c-di-GMP phosphodiesterase
MKNATQFFARQAIVDAQRKLFAYEFYYRDNAGESHMENPRAATASILVALLNQIGLRASAGEHIVFINIDTSILLTDLLLSAPAERFVFAMDSDVQLGNKEREVLKTLHEKGYRFALENVKASREIETRYTTILPYIDYVKFNISATDIESLSGLLPVFAGKILIAERIEIEELFNACKTLGFAYFQGYYFEKPSLISHNRIDPKYLGVVKIYNMLLSGTPIEQVAKEFRHHNELTMQLLQYCNSTTMTNAYPNRSIEELVVKFGSEALKNWLQLIIFSKTGQTVENDKSPLSKLMEQRIDVMHCTIIAMQSEDGQLFDKARLMAFLSLMEPVLGVPLQNILDSVPVDQSIEDALLLHSGRLGKIFALSLALEQADATSVEILMNDLGLDPEVLPTLKNMIKL